MPAVIRSYLRAAERADAADADEIVACFAEDGEVTDEGETRRGHDAIRQWWQGPATVFAYTVDVLGTRALGDDRYSVATRLNGNFPGGIADLDYRFTLRGDLIAKLEIAPPVEGST
jgi:ketosteroid isomerase-like protein